MNVYAGLFLIAFATLSVEITLVRLLSVTTWYHLAFFAISTAMLGMTAGAVRVYLRPDAFTREKLASAASRACLHFALSLPATLLLLCLVPLDLYPSVMSLVALLLTTLACAWPFYFAGIAIAAVLTRHELPIGRLYGADLLGASLGCLFVLGGLEVVDAPSLVLFAGAIGAVAAASFVWYEPSSRPSRAALAVGLLLLLVGVGNALTPRGIRPVLVKGTRFEPASTYYLERWNSFSRVGVDQQGSFPPHYWGASPKAPQELMPQYRMKIDGLAGTAMGRFDALADLEYLRYDVTNVAYAISRRGKACIIGVGGGRDLHSALLFGQEHVTGLEINPTFVDLLENDFRDFAGLADRLDVTLVNTEARSWLSRSSEKYSILQMSLIDTWAATGAGAFSFSENSLYTVEAWDLFLDRLEDGGLFTVSRWHDPKHVGETGRVISLAVAALLGRGVTEPSQHLALVTSDSLSTLLISMQPLSPERIARLVEHSEEMGFTLAALPGKPPADELLRSLLSARSSAELAAAASADGSLNFEPPTDASPYFFNMLRLRGLAEALTRESGVVRGNLVATLVLVALLATLLLVAVATIVVPLWLRGRQLAGTGERPRISWPGAIYFMLIGSGFMLAEIALIQRLTVFLTHPIYALGIILFTLIATTGIGSLLSDRLPLTRPPWLYVYPVVTAACLVVLSFVLDVLLETMVTAPIPSRIAAAIAVIAPTGLLMGLFFPTGMRLAKAASAAETPWYWALNGIFGVLCSVLAILISIHVGIPANLYLAAGCYVAVVAAQMGLRRGAAVG